MTCDNGLDIPEGRIDESRINIIASNGETEDGLQHYSDSDYRIKELLYQLDDITFSKDNKIEAIDLLLKLRELGE